MGAANDDIETALLGPKIGVVDREHRRVIPTDWRGAGLWQCDGASRNRHVVGVLASARSSARAASRLSGPIRGSNLIRPSRAPTFRSTSSSWAKRAAETFAPSALFARP
jgi:hypothetical protein